MARVNRRQAEDKIIEEAEKRFRLAAETNRHELRLAIEEAVPNVDAATLGKLMAASAEYSNAEQARWGNWTAEWDMVYGD